VLCRDPAAESSWGLDILEGWPIVLCIAQLAGRVIRLKMRDHERPTGPGPGHFGISLLDLVMLAISSHALWVCLHLPVARFFFPAHPS